MNKGPDEFRDHIATVDKSGNRIWMYPKKPAGRFYDARKTVSIILLAFLFGAPFITFNGQQLILLNVLERKFILFGLAFWPQDFHLFALALLTLAVFVILFTVVFGRVFCGWVCPQTIFMEMVFRKIEYWIEGDSYQQKKLNQAAWTSQKIARKSIKHLIFYGIAFLIGNTFLAYIIGTDKLIEIITDPPGQHVAGLSAMIIFSTIFYGVFAWFREQVCVMVCPYGRLQSVLLDPNSIVVAYDYKRGEPRGKIKKNLSNGSNGDCIACELCVQVCPTGIDIKNGTQLECVNCTACIDACDAVMDKINRPRGLIRYASLKGIEEGRKLILSPRILGYSSVLVVLLFTLIMLLINRAPVEATILRTPGTLYQETADGQIQNLYNLRLVNKSFTGRTIELRMTDPVGNIQIVSGEKLLLASDGLAESAFFIRMPQKSLTHSPRRVGIEILSDGEVIDLITTTFVGPVNDAPRR